MQTKETKNRKLTPLAKGVIALALLVVGSGSAYALYNELDGNEPLPETTASAEPTAKAKKTPKPAAKPTATPEATPTPEPTPEPTKKASAKDETADSYEFTTAYERKAYAPRYADKVSQFSSGWGVASTDGYGYGDFGFAKMDAIVENAGSSVSSVRILRGGIPLKAGATNNVSFVLSSSVPVNVLVQAYNNENGQILAQQTFRAETWEEWYSMDFRSGVSTGDASIIINIGNDGSQGSREYHTVSVSVLRIVSSSPYSGVSVDQVGYPLSGQKICSFGYDAGDMFDVIDETGNVVFTGAIVAKSYDEYTGEYDCYGDFTELVEPGRYRIRSQIGIESPAFTVSDDPYVSLRDDALRILTLQRCGMTLDEWWAKDMAHYECHNYNAIIYETPTYKDVTGGWHDAGDYGKYIETGAKAADDLLMAYLANPDIWTDTISIPDSKNGLPDILDEVKYELDWMLKMQDANGEVYNTVIPRSISEIVLPEHDDQELVLLFPETTSTGSFAGTMAMASIVFKDIDPMYASKLLTAAKRANDWLDDNPKVTDLDNPEGVNGGVYRDKTDNDARFFTKAALFAATYDTKYLEEAKALFMNNPACANGLSWNQNGGYGRYLILTAKDADKIDPDFWNRMYKSLYREAEDIYTRTVGTSGYLCSLNAFGWGSNSEALNNGIIMSMAYDFSGNQEFQQAAAEQLHYVLGRNCLNLCYVTGYGTNMPRNIHSRVAKANSGYPSGALVGGPDSYREDKLTQAMSENTPPAKMYADNFDSWSTNEITVYYNSALVHLLGRID